MAYRVPRRFIVPPTEPPPYGLLLISFLRHAFFFLIAAATSQPARWKIYIVNLARGRPPFGRPAPRVVEPPGEPPRKIEERIPPRPDRVEAPRPKETPPPKPEAPPPKPEKVELPLPPKAK